MNWWIAAAVLVPPAVAAAVVVVHTWWRFESAKLAVLVAVEDETARHLGDLVPSQREPEDPFWAEFIANRRPGEER